MTLTNTDFESSLSLYKEFFEISKDLMCVSGVDGYFKLVNPAFTKMLGYSKDELLAQPFMSFVHPDDHLSTDKEIESIKRSSGTTDNFENRYISKNGDIIHLQWVSTPVNDQGLIFAIARDVTEQKQLNQDLL